MIINNDKKSGTNRAPCSKLRMGRARINNFFHVMLCEWYVDGLPKYEVQDTHEDNVTTQEDQHWVVALVRTPRI